MSIVEELEDPQWLRSKTVYFKAGKAVGRAMIAVGTRVMERHLIPMIEAGVGYHRISRMTGRSAGVAERESDKDVRKILGRKERTS